MRLAASNSFISQPLDIAISLGRCATFIVASLALVERQCRKAFRCSKARPDPRKKRNNSGDVTARCG